VLELLATGAPLQTILESVVLGVEADNEDMLCSILLLDESGEHLLVGRGAQPAGLLQRGRARQVDRQRRRRLRPAVLTRAA
jgi:hypothetical protein